MFGLVVMVHAGGSPPPNDECSSATIIPGDTAIYNPPLLDTTGAGVEGCSAEEACEVGSVGVSNTVWYEYIPDHSGTIRIDTFGSDYNTVLAVFEYCGGSPPICASPDQLACNDDFPFGTTSQVILDVIAGENYIIKVGDYNTFDGGGLLNFNLRWIPPNDLCDDATLITIPNFAPPPFNTQSAETETCEALETCEVNNVGVSNTVWYEYLACSDGTIDINTNGSSYDTVLSIFDKCGFFLGVDFPCNFGEPFPVELECDDDSGIGLNSLIADFPVVGGESYFIKVADYDINNDGGLLDFNLTFSPLCAGDVTCDDVVGPADLSQLLASWGACSDCPADIDGDDTVGPADLAALLSNWGSCS
jgi:hypothetical protein